MDLLESSDQLHSLDSFINTGMSLTSVVKRSDKELGLDVKDQPMIQRVMTNEEVTTYFMRMKR